MSLPITPAALLSCGVLAFTMKPPDRITRFFRLFIEGIWKRIPDELEGKIAEWIARVLFYLFSLAIWYVVGHIGRFI